MYLFISLFLVVCCLYIQPYSSRSYITAVLFFLMMFVCSNVFFSLPSSYDSLTRKYDRQQFHQTVFDHLNAMFEADTYRHAVGSQLLPSTVSIAEKRRLEESAIPVWKYVFFFLFQKRNGLSPFLSNAFSHIYMHILQDFVFFFLVSKTEWIVPFLIQRF